MLWLLLEVTSSDPAAGAQPLRGEGGNIEPQMEETAKARQQAAPCAASRHQPPCRAPAAVPSIVSSVFAPYGVSSQVQMRQRVQEAKGNKSVPPRQRVGLPAAQGSLRQDVAGIREGSACIPWGCLSGEPGRLPSPPRHKAAHLGKEVKGMWQSQQVHHKGQSTL